MFAMVFLPRAACWAFLTLRRAAALCFAVTSHHLSACVPCRSCDRSACGTGTRSLMPTNQPTLAAAGVGEPLTEITISGGIPMSSTTEERAQASAGELAAQLGE